MIDNMIVIRYQGKVVKEIPLPLVGALEITTEQQKPQGRELMKPKEAK